MFIFYQKPAVNFATETLYCIDNKVKIILNITNLEGDHTLAIRLLSQMYSTDMQGREKYLKHYGGDNYEVFLSKDLLKNKEYTEFVLFATSRNKNNLGFNVTVWSDPFLIK